MQVSVFVLVTVQVSVFVLVTVQVSVSFFMAVSFFVTVQVSVSFFVTVQVFVFVTVQVSVTVFSGQFSQYVRLSKKIGLWAGEMSSSPGEEAGMECASELMRIRYRDDTNIKFFV